MILTDKPVNIEFLEAVPSYGHFKTIDMDDQIKFINNLDQNIASKLKVRIAENYDSFIKLAIESHFPSLAFIYRGEKLLPHISESRISVITYNETSIVESLAENRPTVVFFRPDHFEMTKISVEIYDELKECCVFHETAESAAKHINNIWENVGDWWESPKVRQAINKHNLEYSRISPNPVKDLVSFLIFDT